MKFGQSIIPHLPKCRAKQPARMPAKKTEKGIRAVIKDKPIDAATVQKYLEQKLGEDLQAVRQAMADLAGSFAEDDLRSRAYSLYEQFRPQIPAGRAGWGAKGQLDLELIRSLRQA